MLSDTIRPNIVQKYDGQLAASEGLSGHGTATYWSGNTYTGEFKDSLLHGHGVYTWKSGVVYSGEFSENKLSGSGTYKWTDGATYTGQVLDGYRHGTGRFTLKNTENEYQGNWKNGKPSGFVHSLTQGTCFYRDGASYAGEWLNGKRNGRGIMKYASGNIYDGEWLDNAKHGKGKMSWVDRNEEYDGEWMNGKPNGFGLQTWRLGALRNHQYPQLNVYKGGFQDGKRNGHGIFYYSSGAHYEGEWKDNLKVHTLTQHGQGKYVSENGRVYIGAFVEDSPKTPFNLFDNDQPYVFKFQDLFQAEHTSNTVQKELNAIVFRYSVELRKLYQKYANLEQLRKNSTVMTVSRHAVWIMLRNIRVGTMGVTTIYKNPHDSTAAFIYYEFLELLIILAEELYRNTKGKSLHDVGPPASFAYLIKQDLEPLLSSPPESGATKESTTKSKLFDSFLMQYNSKIESMYWDIATKHANSLEQVEKDKTVTIREFVILLKTFNIFDTFQSLTLAKILEYFSCIMPYIKRGTQYNLEYEIISLDIFDVLFNAALFLSQTQYKKYLDALTLRISEQEHHRPSVSIFEPDGKLQEQKEANSSSGGLTVGLRTLLGRSRGHLQLAKQGSQIGGGLVPPRKRAQTFSKRPVLDLDKNHPPLPNQLQPTPPPIFAAPVVIDTPSINVSVIVNNEGEERSPTSPVIPAEDLDNALKSSIAELFTVFLERHESYMQQKRLVASFDERQKQAEPSQAEQTASTVTIAIE